MGTREEEGTETGLRGGANMPHQGPEASPAPGPACRGVWALVYAVHSSTPTLGVVPVTQHKPDEYLLNGGTDEIT